MIPNEIESLLAEIQYHFETVDLLIDFDRYRESIPSAVLVLEKFAQLDQIAPLAASKTAGLESIRLPKEVSAKDLMVKLRSWAGNLSAVNADELKELQYEIFLTKLKNRIDARQTALKQKFETAAERRMKMTAWAALAALAVAVAGGFVFYQYFSRSWGLSGEFFVGQNFENKVDRRLCGQIDFSSAEQFSAKVPSDNFSARWTGTLEVPEAGRYIFTAFADDGVRLYIDGKPVIDDWKERWGEIQSAGLVLTKGRHLIKIEYFEAAGGEGLKLYWESEKLSRQLISSKYLRS